MTFSHSPTQTDRSLRRRLGLPLTWLIGLALLALPRVVLHDLGAIEEGTTLNALFVLVPPLVWVAVVLWKRVPNAFLTLLVVGVCYGALLALGHQLMWDATFGGEQPRLGGNLAGTDPEAQSLILRTFAVGSSLVTGTLVGAIAGAVAWVLGALTGRSPGGRGNADESRRRS
ncbi:hypothetical protein [Georgenia halophila]